MNKEIILLNSNFEIIGFSENFYKNFNSFHELISFAENLQKEMFKNNGKINVKDEYVIKYERYPVITRDKNIMYITKFTEILNNKKEKNEFDFNFDFNLENNNFFKFDF